MQKILSLTLAAVLLLGLMGCIQQGPPLDTSPPVMESTGAPLTTAPPETTVPATDPTEAESTESTEPSEVTDPTQSTEATEETEQAQPQKPKENTGKQEDETKPTDPPETLPPETAPQETVAETILSPKDESPAAKEAEVIDLNHSDVEAAILKYINLYRSSPLTKLGGMSKVARERSKQILSNFDHVTKDIREAHAKYQYGELVDMTIHSLPESENYYSSHTGEAIAYCGQGLDVKSADEMGQILAQQMKESSGHWSYVGSSSNVYCGIGCTKVNTDWGTVWYVCVMVGSTNFG